MIFIAILVVIELYKKWRDPWYEPSGSVVFTVSTSSTLVAHSVVQGTLLGDQIVISEGLTPDMRIVTDARGLKEGVEVTVAN